MAFSSVLRTDSLPQRLRAFWATFSATLIGDIVATAIAIIAMSALFLAGSFAVIGLSRAAQIVGRLLGSG